MIKNRDFNPCQRKFFPSDRRKRCRRFSFFSYAFFIPIQQRLGKKEGNLHAAAFRCHHHHFHYCWVSFRRLLAFVCMHGKEERERKISLSRGERRNIFTCFIDTEKEAYEVRTSLTLSATEATAHLTSIFLMPLDTDLPLGLLLFYYRATSAITKTSLFRSPFIYLIFIWRNNEMEKTNNPRMYENDAAKKPRRSSLII